MVWMIVPDEQTHTSPVTLGSLLATQRGGIFAVAGAFDVELLAVGIAVAIVDDTELPAEKGAITPVSGQESQSTVTGTAGSFIILACSLTMA